MNCPEAKTRRINKLPKHIAIIMDGNGRWAKQRQLPRMQGHWEGFKTVRKIVKACGEIGIEILTLFAFSSENWQRPEQEVSGLMNLFLVALQNEAEHLNKNNVQLRIIGALDAFDQELQERINLAQKLTVENTGLKLVIAANYGGQWDILQAVKKIICKIERKKLMPSDITAHLFSSFLSLKDLPPPDLFIRTSGEYRISNFLLWHFAYTELYFSEVLWPDFNEKELEKALIFYDCRERRFGCTSEQLITKKE